MLFNIWTHTKYSNLTKLCLFSALSLKKRAKRERQVRKLRDEISYHSLSDKDIHPLNVKYLLLNVLLLLLLKDEKIQEQETVLHLVFNFQFLKRWNYSWENVLIG